jgi:hypothetical protein
LGEDLAFTIDDVGDGDEFLKGFHLEVGLAGEDLLGAESEWGDGYMFSLRFMLLCMLQLLN